MLPCSTRFSSPTGVKSPSVSSARCGSSASARSACIRRRDRGALHVAYADEAFLLGPTPAAESYLNVERILDAAVRTGAQAIHPGYGFLAENAGFAQAVEDAGLVWIGPPPAAIELMGNKTAARTAMQAAGVPIIPGTTEPVALRRGAARARRGDRLPTAHQGGGGRRRQGDGGGALARPGGESV